MLHHAILRHLMVRPLMVKTEFMKTPRRSGMQTQHSARTRPNFPRTSPGTSAGGESASPRRKKPILKRFVTAHISAYGFAAGNVRHAKQKTRFYYACTMETVWHSMANISEADLLLRRDVLPSLLLHRQEEGARESGRAGTPPPLPLLPAGGGRGLRPERLSQARCVASSST